VKVEVNGRLYVLLLSEHRIGLVPTTFGDSTPAEVVERVRVTGVLPDNAWVVPYEDFAAARRRSARRLRMTVELRNGTRLELRETGETGVLTLGPRDPHEILTGVAGALARIGCSAPRTGLPLATPAGGRLSPESTAAVSRGRRFTGLLFVLAAVPLAVVALAGGGFPAAIATIVCAYTGVLWMVIDVATRPGLGGVARDSW
jgi:hypothetical protein